MRRVWGAVVLIAMAGMMPALQAPVRADDATPTLPAPTFPATEAPPTVTPSPLPVVQVESSPVATAAVAGAADICTRRRNGRPAARADGSPAAGHGIPSVPGSIGGKRSPPLG